VTGLSALRDVYTKVWQTPGFSLAWKPLKAEVSRSGDLGYTFGTYERRHTAEGNRSSRRVSTSLSGERSPTYPGKS
jgi:hypothetical protein